MNNSKKEEIEDESDCEIVEENMTIVDLDTTGAESFRADTDVEVEDLLFQIEFPNEGKFEKHKTFVKDAVKNCFRQSGVNVSFGEDRLTIGVCNAGNATQEEDSSHMLINDTTPAKHITPSVPSYKKTIKSVMDNEENEKNHKLRSMCFNCCGEHNLKDCPESRDQQKINKARKQFSQGRVEKYHVDSEQKFAHLKPGTISTNLREALGINNDRNLPAFIHKMRKLGYPPGWLEHTKVSQATTVSLFGLKV